MTSWISFEFQSDAMFKKTEEVAQRLFVSEIDEGFQAMEKMMTVRNGKTLEEAFAVAFPVSNLGRP